MMNKVARYRGISNGKPITKEPGYIYVTEDGITIVDELRKEHVIPAKEAMDEQNASDKSEASADMTAILARLQMLEDKVNSMKKANSDSVVAEEGTPIAANDPDKDFVISGDTNQTANITAKSVEMDGMTVDLPADAPLTNGNGMFINASDEVAISGSEVSMDKSTSSNCIKVVEAETMTIKDTTFSGTTYNTIMTGQNSTNFLKNMIIDNCDFNEDCKHINIWFAGYQDNATLTISNCHFRRGEQFLCISDFAGTDNKLTVNLVNCVIDQYEKDGTEYEGIILMDGRNVNVGEFEEKNPFGAGKVTININNVTVAGEKLTADNFIMGNGGAGQMLYMYKAKEKANVAYSEETANLFPTINFK